MCAASFPFASTPATAKANLWETSITVKLPLIVAAVESSAMLMKFENIAARIKPTCATASRVPRGQLASACLEK
jgi:hypothetical protein